MQSTVLRVCSIAASLAGAAFTRGGDSPRRVVILPDGRSNDEHRQALAREIEACDFRLALMPTFAQEQVNDTFRAELLRKRDQAAAELAALVPHAVGK